MIRGAASGLASQSVGGSVLALAAGRATANQSITSSTVLATASGLSFAIGANEEWIVQFDLDVGALLSTTGMKLAVNAPSGAVLDFDAALDQIVVAAANVVFGTTTAIATAIDFTAAGLVSITNAGCRADLWVLNGSTAGTIALQFAQSTSSGTAITIKKGSSFFGFRVA